MSILLNFFLSFLVGFLYIELRDEKSRSKVIYREYETYMKKASRMEIKIKKLEGDK